MADAPKVPTATTRINELWEILKTVETTAEYKDSFVGATIAYKSHVFREVKRLNKVQSK